MIRYGVLAVALLLAPPRAADRGVSLFDGKSLAGWTTVGGKPIEKGWEVKDGALHCFGTERVDIVTTRTFADFDLSFEWKATAKANSGVKYRFGEYLSGRNVGAEYQVIDGDSGEAAPGPHAAASLYDLFAPDPNVRPKPAGAWNKGRIVARGDRIAHYLNGKKVLAVTLGTAGWRAALAASKFHDLPDFAARPGKIMLQDHGHEVWFRNVRIKEPR